jgi:hypothetical protein
VERINDLNSLLRGELAAMETYRQALTKVDTNTRGAADICQIHRDHCEAVHTLREFVQKAGGQAEESSGAWGMCAKTVEGMAKLFGVTAALRALKEGEKVGAKSYQEALEDEAWPPEVQGFILTTLLLKTRAHIRVLERLIAAQ